MKILTEIKYFTKRQPLKTMGVIVVIWIFLTAINLTLHRLVSNLDTPLYFPISEFSGPTFHILGLPYAFLFLGVLYWVVKGRGMRLGLFQIWIIGVVFIVLGNLIQGDVDVAFRQPFYQSNIQYYHDAIKISSWREWLSTFNVHQTELLVHSKTHPPFAVLLHFFVLRFGGNHLLLLAGVFILVSSLSIVIMGFIFNELGVECENRNGLALLFSVIPAANIFMAVSLDGIILTTFAIYLLGLVILVHRKKFAMTGLLLFVSGLLLANLLTFGGMFLIAVGVLVGVREYILNRKGYVLICTSIAIGLSGLLIYGLNLFLHYNHLQAFLTASHIENPQGFRGLTQPLVYVMTRIEGISEIALFFSFGCLANLFHKNRLRLRLCEYDDDIVGIVIVAIVTLGSMFLMGAYRTGETARACLFIYPFMMLIFYKSDIVLLRDLIIVASLQTVFMQLCGNYFW